MSTYFYRITINNHSTLFGLLDEEELAVLASQVEIRRFAARQRIFKISDRPLNVYVLLAGAVRVTTVDDAQLEVVIDEPEHGGFFGFASMIGETPHQSNAMALEDSECLKLDRNDIEALHLQKPMAGLFFVARVG
jgi:CRP/FNR family cyclic AMP-dependent transcriptional regulator